MSNRNRKQTLPNTEVHTNWEGLAQFLGWNGSIDELKRVELDQPLAKKTK